jgi:hypothetical protein
MALIAGCLVLADAPAQTPEDDADSARVRETPKSSFVVVEDGGTGPHPAVATEDAALEAMTIFRPRDLSTFGDGQKLPVVLWGNGACANTTWEHNW